MVPFTIKTWLGTPSRFYLSKLVHTVQQNTSMMSSNVLPIEECTHTFTSLGYWHPFQECGFEIAMNPIASVIVQS